MMMATRNDIKDRLIHNQSPYPTKDKVLSYTIPVDHSESLLFCSSTSQDNGSFITPDDDPCNNGRDSLASFLDEGLGTSLDGVDEIASPIFPTLGRNDSGIFSSDEGAGGIVQGGLTTTTTHNHASLISPPISSSTSTCSSISSSSSLCGGSGSSSVSCSSNNIIPVAEVVSWKGSSGSGRTSSSTTTTNHHHQHPSNILLSPPTATISVVTDSATGIPSIICTSAVNSSGSSSGVVRVVKSEGGKVSGVPATKSGKSGGPSQSQQGGQQRCKSMPLGRQGPQKCTICDKVFSNASALTKHKLTHSDERRHACATCGKAFKRQDHLNGHMLTHRNKKPFECKSKGCGKSYCDARSLRRHVENRHGHDVLESMNLTSHHNKHSKHNHNNNQNNNINHEQPPQPELPAQVPPVATVTFCPVSKAESCPPGERSRQRENGGAKKLLDCMPVLHPEQPQLQLQLESEKITISAPPPLPVLQKAGESVVAAPPPPPVVLQGASAAQVPIVLKRENVSSVFDFDESVEDAPVSFTQEKLLSSLNNSAIKVSNIIDSSKFAPLPDIRLIQEWTKRLGDSKVALFLASSSAASSIAQLAGPMTSIQLDGQQHAVALPGGGHAFIPTSENGLFSVTPISLVPTSSGEFTFKPAMISVPTSESPKPLYIVPSEPLLSTIPPPTIQVSAGGSFSQTSVPPPLPVNCLSSSLISSVPKLDQSKPKVEKESKSKSEKDKGKGGIGASLANRIKTKLKAGSLKKLGKANSKLSIEVPTTPSGSELPKHCPSIVVTSNIKANGEEIGGGKVTMMPAPQLPPPPSTTSMPTIAITAGVGVTSWCESPKDCLLTGMEEDRLSEGAEGEDKPVECSICCRRFKNTPALNGHMRLHGGYFKKDTEGSKKKDQVSKEPTNSTPLQTASVSVRALIEEKIKERRNNLLKLAAAAAAEKAANGGAPPLEQTSQAQSTPTNGSSPTKSKSDKHKSPPVVTTPSPAAAVCGMEGTCSTPPTTLIAQPKLLLDGVKLKMEPNPEKDRNCDHETNNISSSASLTNNNPSSTPVIDPSFQDLSILIGDDGNVIGGGRGNGVSDLLPSTIRMDTNQNLNSLPIIDKSNFTLLDCGINPEDLCQAFHLIYVDNNNGADLTSAMNQATFGKVSKMFQDPVLEMSSFVGTMNDNQNIKVEPVLCQPHEDPCNLPWEWRNSTSSDNTDNSLSNVQDCVNSLLCSSSETTDESSKDPVAGGGYCYTPMYTLSPSSTFCLTPGPDSPFETTSHSLSFICPSPTMGNTSSFHDAASTLINSPSMEPLFASEQPPQILPSTNLSMSSGQTHGINLDKYMPIHEQSIENHIFINNFDGLDQKPPIGLSNVPQMSQQQQQQINQIPNHHQSGGTVESLPSINSFPTMITSSTCGSVSSASDLCKFGTNNFGPTLISTSPKDIVLHCPVNNGVQQSFVPFEVFTPVPIPKKISEKWSCGRMEKSRKINVGPEYQAEIPNFRGSKGRTKSYRSTDEKLWDPSILDLVTLDEVDKYLEFACCSAVPGGGMNKEYALHLLTLSRGNIREALLRLMDKLPSLPPKLRNYSYVENQRWTSEEIMAFQISLVQAGKDFSRIAKGIGTKGHSECVSFYYFWKKVCPNEYEVMRQIWKDRLDHQSQSLLTGNMSNNCNLSFLVPAQDFRSLCK